MKNYLLLFFLLLPLLNTRAQVNADSLRIVADNAALPAAERLQAMYELADHYRNFQPDSTRLLAESQLNLARTIRDTAALGRAYMILGSHYQDIGDYIASLKVLQQGLKFSKAAGKSTDVAKVLNLIGGNQFYMGDFDQALEYFHESLELSRELDDKFRISQLLANIGAIFIYQGKYTEALEYLQQSLRISRDLGKKDISFSLVNIGAVYFYMGDYGQSLKYYQQGLEVVEKRDEKRRAASILGNIGEVYHLLGQDSLALPAIKRAIELAGVDNNPDKAWALNVEGEVLLSLKQILEAEEAFQQALRLGIEMEDTKVQVNGLVGLAKVFRNQRDWILARQYALEGLDLAQEVGLIFEMRDAAEILWQSQQALGQPAAALKSYQTYVQMRDSLASEENQRATLAFEYRQKALQDSLAFVQQQAETEVAYQKQLARRNYLLYGGLGAALIVGLGFFFWQQRRSRERELALQRERTEHLEKIDRLKDQFLANTSHELRTPLNGIIGLSESLLEQENDPYKEENLSMIVSSGKRLASLVNDILDFSKLRNQQIELRKRPVDLKTLVQMVLRIHQPLVEGKDLQLINDLPDDLPLLLADEDRLQQILFNLVGNAAKFTETGYVKISAQTEEDKLRIAVEDTGIGVPKDKQEAIFQAFEQGDGSIQREFAGTGLGLSISKQLVELHGGKIWVESPPAQHSRAGKMGQGSTFFFTLPLAEQVVGDAGIMPRKIKTPETASSRQLSKKAIAKANTKEPVVPNSEERMRILVVDDEPINQQVIKNHLQEGRFELVQAMNGEEALQQLEKDQRFDLVLLDVMMPRMSGYEVCQRIREQFLPSELPIIMVTAKNQVSDLVQGLDMGANDYLAKPFTKNEFLARLKTHLSLHRINKVTNRFVPAEFIRTLGKRTLTEIHLGDQVERKVTVLFTDIRNYTGLAEQMSPEENFKFVNAYAGRMGPIIDRHHGFINQYLGDGIMAIFQESSDNALRAAIEMQREVQRYNEERLERGRQPIRVGMGMHKGPLIMGIIGDERRTDAATISDAVNAAARMEDLTKRLGAKILLSAETLTSLSDAEAYQLRYLGRVRVKGRQTPVEVYECFDSDPKEVQQLKQAWMDAFDEAVRLYTRQDFARAIVRLQEILEANSQDQVASNLLAESKQYLVHGVPEGWVG